MDMLRSLAVLAVVIHHWLLFNPDGSSIRIFTNIADLIQALAGTVVHLFFILSGCGLTVSYFKKGSVSWREWAKRRFRKIVVPYLIIVSLTFVLANFASFIFPNDVKTGFSPYSLLTYLTFTRNFYSPGWGLNPTLWFMPVIIGLYILFPFLVQALEKRGPLLLLAISVLITYGSIAACIALGYPVNHQSAIFSFYVIEFSFGMFIGYRLAFYTGQLNRLLGLKMFCLGFGLYAVSWSIQRYWSLGGAFNDIFTAVAVFLMALNMCRMLVRLSPQKMVNFSKEVSKHSYVMYLIHGPIILFVMKPLLAQAVQTPINSLVMVFLACLYCGLIFVLARLISPLVYFTRSRR
jgi:peptidoglycan/LPS O-acetylase OafA/YrhL